MSNIDKVTKLRTSEISMVSNKDNFYRTIGDVSSELSVPPHVLRFWESKFLDIKPHKRKGGHRYYSKSDIDSIKQIKHLLYEKGFTIKGAKRYLKEQKNQGKSEVQQSLFGDGGAKQGEELMVSDNDNSFEIEKYVGNLDKNKLDLFISKLEGIKKTLQP